MWTEKGKNDKRKYKINKRTEKIKKSITIKETKYRKGKS